jgi:hypothetical protein
VANGISEPVEQEETYETYSGGEAELELEDAPTPEDEESKTRAALDSLAQEIEGKFTTRKSKRQIKEQQWLEAERMYLGSIANQTYASPDKPMDRGTSTTKIPEFNVVATRCDTAISVLWAKQFAGGDRNWQLRPSDKPSSQEGTSIPYVQAAMACELMEKTIQDQLARGRWGQQMRMGIEDMVVKGTLIVKSPVNGGEMYTRYEQLSNEGNPIYAPRVAQKDFPCAKRVDPWFFFPDETAVTIKQAKDAIVLHPMSKEQLAALKLDETFDAQNIDEALMQPPADENADTYFGFTTLTDSSSDAMRGKYKVLEYHGPLTVDQMGALGIEKTYESPSKDYFAEVWVCNGKVLRAELSNIEGANCVPFAVCVWKRDPSSVFGIGLATVLSDPQKVINKTYEMIMDNSAISSGSQLVIDKTKITPANGEWVMRPQKIWFNNEYDTDVTKAFYEFTPINVTQQLVGFLNLVREFAQEEAAVPFFMPGTQSGIANDTAFGTKQIMDQSTTVIDHYNERLDDEVVAKVISGFYAWNMQYNPDQSIKGDFEVDVSSSSDERSAAIYLGELEKLAILSSQDPDMAQLIDKRELTKARLRAMKLRDQGIIKSDEQLQAEAEQAAQNPPPPDPAMMELQLKGQEIEVKKQELELKQQELQLRIQQEMRQAQMDHDERMAAAYARLREAEAQVLSSQNEERVAMMKLAAASEQHRDKLMVELQKTNQIEATKKFLAGINLTKDFEKVALQKEEMEYAKKNGKGI